MGVGLVPFYEPLVPEEATYNGDGKGLADEFETLNGIAARAGLPPLSQFVSGDGDFDEFDEEAAEPTELTYHPIPDGLRAVEGLLREIGSNPKAASRLSDAACTIEELEELARSLKAANEFDARFCLFFM